MSKALNIFAYSVVAIGVVIGVVCQSRTERRQDCEGVLMEFSDDFMCFECPECGYEWVGTPEEEYDPCPECGATP